MVYLENNLRGINHIGIPCANIEKTKAWYSLVLGFLVIHEPVIEEPDGKIHVAFLEKNGLVLEFYQLYKQIHSHKNVRYGSIDYIAFRVSNIKQAFSEIGSRCTAQYCVPGYDALLRENQQQKYFIVTGPDNEKIKFIETGTEVSANAINSFSFSHIGIPVCDLSRSLSFYRKFGFEKMPNELNNEKKSVIIENNGFQICLFQQKNDANFDTGPINHVALSVTNIDKAFSELCQNNFYIEEPAPVYLHFWKNGVRYFKIIGLSGESIEFIEVL